MLLLLLLLLVLLLNRHIHLQLQLLTIPPLWRLLLPLLLAPKRSGCYPCTHGCCQVQGSRKSYLNSLCCFCNARLRTPCLCKAQPHRRCPCLLHPGSRCACLY